MSTHLLGKVLCYNKIEVIITETESYIGMDDPACHAARGMTKRTKLMFGPAGCSYIYFIYGKYYCFNIVTEALGFPAATLIRGIQLLQSPYTYLDGPGKMCRFLGLNLNQNGIDMTKSKELYVKDIGITFPYDATPRIGISKGLDKIWRYVIKDKVRLKPLLVETIG